MQRVHTKFFPYREIGILVVLLVAITFFARQPIGRFMWHVLGAPRTALLLTTDARFAMEIGNYYFNGGGYDLEQANRAYQKALLINPLIILGHYQLARINFTKNNFNLAIEEINKELEMNHSNLRSLYIRGLIYGYSGNLAQAEEDFSRFIQWAPKEWAGYNDLAWVLLKEKKYKQAYYIAQEGIEHALNGEKNAWLWNSRGVAELNLDLHEQARNSFEQALVLAEAITSANWQRSYPGNNPEDAESGLVQFKEAIQINLRNVQEEVQK